MTKRRRILHADKIIQNVVDVFCLLMFLQLKGFYCLASNPILLYSTASDIRVSVNNGISTIVSNLEQGSAVDFLHRKELVCWSDTADLIQCMHYNNTHTSEKIKIVSDSLITPTGLAIDWYTDKIYWTDSETNKVEVIGIYNRYRRVLYWSEVDLARAIAVVPQQGLMFWTDWGEVPKIERAGMNGDPSTRKIIVKDKIIWPNGITVDYNNQLIYWVDAKLKFIDVMDFNGENRKRVIKVGLEYPYALTFFSEKLFWTDWKNWSIYTWDMTTTGPIRELIKSNPVPVDIKIYDGSRQLMPATDYPCKVDNGGCSHLCLLSPISPGFNCSCPTGIKLKAGSTTTCYNSPQSLLIVAQRSSISKISLDSPDFTPYTLPLKDVKRTLSVDYDPKTEFIYWADSVAKTICRARLDGSEQTVVLHNIGVPDSIALDPLARNIYWSDRVSDTITVAKMDGTSKKVIIHNDLYEPRAIALHPIAGLMFWSDWDEKKPKIERANLDGSDRKLIVTERITWPNGIALDTVHNKLYWGDAKTHKIEVCDLDGSGRTEVHSTEINHIFGLTLLGDYLYWTDMQKRTLDRVNRYTGGDRQTLVEQIPNMMGVAAVDAGAGAGAGAGGRGGGNACSRGDAGCSHLCFNTPARHLCSCPLGLELGADKKTCFEPEAFLLYARQQTIGVLSIYSANNSQVLPIRDVKDVSALALYVPGSKIYWSDSSKTIYRCSMDGSNVEKILEWTGTVEGMAIDNSAQNIYWTDSSTQRIEVARLDGSSRRTLIWQGLKKPKSIVLEPRKGYMYWSEVGSRSIRRARLDGGGAAALAEQAGRVHALALDAGDAGPRALYWAELDAPALRRLPLGGGGRAAAAALLVADAAMPYALAVFADRLYWGDWNTGQVHSVSKTDGSDRRVHHSGLDYISELTVHQRNAPTDNSQCDVDNGGCDQLCLPLPGDFRCSCAAHYKLEKDNVTCAEPEEFILFAMKNAIGRLVMGTGECTDAYIPITGLKSVRAIEYDPIQKSLYFVEEETRGIRRLSLAGARASGAGAALVAGTAGAGAGAGAGARHVALDALGRALYWAGGEARHVNVTWLDRAAAAPPLLLPDDITPRQLAFHQTARFLIWNDIGYGAIMRSNVDGTEPMELVKTANVTAMTVDQTSTTVYWAVNRQIHAVELDGTNKRVVWQGGWAGSLAAANGWLTWGGERALLRLPLNRRDAPAATVPHVGRVTALLTVRRLPNHPCMQGGGCGDRRCGVGGKCGCGGKCVVCPRAHFACPAVRAVRAVRSVPRCLPDHYKCDGQADCADGWDEAAAAGCACAGGVRCAGGGCADSLAGCTRGARCLPTHAAPPDAFRCDENLCLAPHLLCDGQAQCSDRSDESPGACGEAGAAGAGAGAAGAAGARGAGGGALAACGAAGGAAAAAVLGYAALRWLRRRPAPPPPPPPHADTRLSPLGASCAESFSTDSSWSRVPLNPPPSPASWGGGKAGAPPGAATRRPPRVYRCMTRVPPPTPASTDAGDSEPDAPPPSPVYTRYS